MDTASLLAVALCFGLFVLVLAMVLAVASVLRLRQNEVVRRFSGVTSPVEAALSGADPVMLRRAAAPALWQKLLPGAAQAEGLAAFGAEIRRIAVVTVVVITTGVVILLHAAIGLNLILGLAAGLLLSAVVWYFWARARYRRRLAQIEEAVPEALDMIVRSLRVGQPVATAIQTVGQELNGPIAAEFSESARRISYGQDPVRALREMAQRCDNQNLRFFAAAVAIQSNSGGNLAEVLERLCTIARGRQQLRRKVRSITAEAKWSGMFLSCFPLGAVVMLLTINPDYFSEISDKPFFLPMLTVVGVLLGMNVLFMRWLVKIE
ncbi:type II secretion system F family protein [Xinfangfangia sp. CPCC 101601]|uniref:Type II secretion system F family protein n=1 Tax=Pseudogemmobacter lacusdianii TaxID=3069608 RepID=A0ABU0VUF2_9RHOB|nr:type II secretion system F family protein [Xinfangfangia sp. CPCC 101601]MDQ2065364.1 type II secretion system F family protein [Xinfangfangia sp. CPCC 101601]